MATRFVPDPEAQQDIPGGLARYNPRYYQDQVAVGSALDTTYEFRVAAAHAKDRARNQLVSAIKLEEKRLREQQLTTFSLSYLTDDFNKDFSGEAKGNVLATRSIDGVDGADDDAIKL